MNQLEIIASQKGGQKLLLNGYSFTVKTKSVHTIRWECSERKSQQCEAKLTTKKDDNSITSQTPTAMLENLPRSRCWSKNSTSNAKYKNLPSQVAQNKLQSARAWAISHPLSGFTLEELILWKEISTELLQKAVLLIQPVLRNWRLSTRSTRQKMVAIS